MKQEVKCPFCKDTITGGLLFECFGCHAHHHRDCWVEGSNKCSSCKTFVPIVVEPSPLKKAFHNLVNNTVEGLNRVAQPVGTLVFGILMLAANLAIVYNVNFSLLTHGQSALTGITCLVLLIGSFVSGFLGFEWLYTTKK